MTNEERASIFVADPSRIFRSASGQFVVSASTTPVTQQFMSQEVMDKELEVEKYSDQNFNFLETVYIFILQIILKLIFF